MAKLSSGAKIGLGLLVGAGVLFFGKSAFASTDDVAPPPPVPPPGSSQAERDAADAQKATAVVGLALTSGTGGLIWFTEGAAAPYAASIAGTVGTAWSALSTRDKARVFRGETT